MRNTPLYIAWRYLFARKSHNAINVVSAVSALGVCVATAAMVCVLSVLNGFSALVEGMFSAFNPELRIEATDGKTFRTSAEAFSILKESPEVAVYSETIEETALISFEERQVPVTLKGTDTNFSSLTLIDSIIYDGQYLVYDGAFERAVLGVGLAHTIGINPYSINPIRIYVPRRGGKVNLLRPENSFNQAAVFIAGTFSVQQVEYDDHYMLVSLDLARNLLDYAPDEVTAVELKLAAGTRPAAFHNALQTRLGDGFRVLNRYEQQEDYFKIVNIEKWLTFLLLVFILLIASFNVIGSLSMLMIDKRESVSIMQSMGADSRFVRRVFLYEGWLISLLGSLVGLVAGVLLCLLQQTFGLLKLGSGVEYVISAYPVRVEALDVLLVLAVVLVVGVVVSWIPVRTIHPERMKS